MPLGPGALVLHRLEARPRVHYYRRPPILTDSILNLEKIPPPGIFLSVRKKQSPRFFLSFWNQFFPTFSNRSGTLGEPPAFQEIGKNSKFNVILSWKIKNYIVFSTMLSTSCSLMEIQIWKQPKNVVKLTLLLTCFSLIYENQRIPSTIFFFLLKKNIWNTEKVPVGSLYINKTHSNLLIGGGVGNKQLLKCQQFQRKIWIFFNAFQKQHVFFHENSRIHQLLLNPLIFFANYNHTQMWFRFDY